jgi:phage terminase large subunit
MERRILIDPSCEKLIKSLDTWTYAEDESDSRPDKKSGNDHMPDALKYLVWMEFRMNGGQARNVRITGF